MRLLLPIAMLALACAALPVAAGEDGTLSVQIIDVFATRDASAVLVFVDLAGRAPDLLGLVGLPVGGDVDVTSPTPCWPDHGGACAEVVTTKTRSFLVAAGPGALWEARVGPFEYAGGLDGKACEALEVRAQVEAAAESATDSAARLVCPS